MPSGSFKDLEADAVLARLTTRPERVVVLASAGNTAAAFATACTRLQRRCVIVVTHEALDRIHIGEAQGDTVTVVSITGGAAYDDAIALSRGLIDDNLFILEGGVRNVARRDGMGIALGVALEDDQTMPDIYVQAIGSAAGAIAVLETAQKAQARYPQLPLPKLYLSQNAPFTPVARSYARRSPRLLKDEETISRHQIAQIMAPVLTNMAPPYEIAGGIYDVLRRSDGQVTSVSNADALAASDEFLQREGVELDGAAAVALASLRQFAATEPISDTQVLLHLTGGRDVRDAYRPRVALTSTIAVDRELAKTERGIAQLRAQLGERYG